MKTIIKSLFLSVLLFGATTVGLTLTYAGTAVAHDGEDHSKEETAQAEAPAEDAFVYEAQAADTYTQMVRKAIQSYGIENSVNLSGAEIVFAETNLTLEAGSPQLEVGQKVSISKETVKKWVEAAQKLDDATEGLWNYYVQFVDFNTDSVGENRSA